MTIKLGGWWRIWIAISAIYGLAVFVLAITSYPKIENIPYDNSHLKLLRDSSLKSIVGEEIRYKGLPADAVTVKEIEMPNGAKLTVPLNTAMEQMQHVAEDYMRVLNILVKEKRQSFIIQYILAWIVPCLSVLLLSYLSRWIYRGFKTNKA